MSRQPIDIDEFLVRPQLIWTNPGLLLTSGSWAEKQYNAMTIGWGSIGVMWKRPFIQIVVRPGRYTYGFVEKYDTFTVCALPRKLDKAIALLGAKSGRDGDKIAESKLTPIASSLVAAPSFAEAELILECRKIYWQDMAKENFLDPSIEDRYPRKDYHRIYYGEILAVFGEEQYRAK